MDGRWEGDIPYGAFVAVLSTVSFSNSDDPSHHGERTLSMNLAAVHVLATPIKDCGHISF